MFSSSAVFAPSCISHTALTTRNWNSIRIGDASLSDTLHCWAKSNTSRRAEDPEGRRGTQEPGVATGSDRHAEGTLRTKIRHAKRKKQQRQQRAKCRKCRRRMKRKRKNSSGRRAKEKDASSPSPSEGGHHSNGFASASEPAITRSGFTDTKMLSDSPGHSSQGASQPKGKEKRRRKNKQKRGERRKKKRKKKKQRKNRKREERRNKKRKERKKSKPIFFLLLR